MWNISGLIFFLFAYFFLFQGTSFIRRPLQTEPWREIFPTKSFPRVLLWVHHTSLLMTNPLYTLHIRSFLSIQKFTIRFFFRSAHMLKNSDCFGQFHYLSNALNLHCVNNNPFCQLCMDFPLSSKKYLWLETEANYRSFPHENIELWVLRYKVRWGGLKWDASMKWFHK